jgi:hypothetical protein
MRTWHRPRSRSSNIGSRSHSLPGTRSKPKRPLSGGRRYLRGSRLYAKRARETALVRQRSLLTSIGSSTGTAFAATFPQIPLHPSVPEHKRQRAAPGGYPQTSRPSADRWLPRPHVRLAPALRWRNVQWAVTCSMHITSCLRGCRDDYIAVQPSNGCRSLASCH